MIRMFHSAAMRLQRLRNIHCQVNGDKSGLALAQAIPHDGRIALPFSVYWPMRQERQKQQEGHRCGLDPQTHTGDITLLN